MAQITYANKVKIDDDPSLPAINKVRDVDMNEIKNVVNENASETDANTQSIVSLQNGNVYSTNEVKTNEVWIDGKPIYRKVLDITSIGASGIEYNHGISNFGTLIDVYGSWDRTAEGRQPLVRTLPASDANAAYAVSIGDITDTRFRLHYGTRISGVTHIYVIFIYTKTTD